MHVLLANRTRDDTVRCIVSSLTDDSNRELAEELVKAEPLHMDESYSSEHEEEKPEEWLPDPIDADPSRSLVLFCIKMDKKYDRLGNICYFIRHSYILVH